MPQRQLSASKLALGGGAGLWLATYAGGLRVAALALAAVCLACMWVVIVTMLIGAVQARYGSVAMLLVEAGLGVVSVAAYAVLVLILRPEPTLDVELGSKSLA